MLTNIKIYQFSIQQGKYWMCIEFIGSTLLLIYIWVHRIFNQPFLYIGIWHSDGKQILTSVNTHKTYVYNPYETFLAVIYTCNFWYTWTLLYPHSIRGGIFESPSPSFCPPQILSQLSHFLMKGLISDFVSGIYIVNIFSTVHVWWGVA